MYPQKRKRSAATDNKKSGIRLLLVSLMVLPGLFFVLRPGVGYGLMADGIALSVMVCAAVYLIHQGIIWGIRTYLGTDAVADIDPQQID